MQTTNPVSALGQGRPILWLAYRGFLTLVMSFLALVGATDSTSGIVAVAIGLVLDILRSLVAPEFRMEAEEMNASIQAAASNDDELQKHRRQQRIEDYPLWAAWIYVFIFLLWGAGMPGEVRQSAIAIFAPVQDLTYQIFPVQRLHEDVLIEGRAPGRAVEVAHLYAVMFSAVLLSLFINAMRINVHYAHIIAWSAHNIASEKVKVVGAARSLLVLILPISFFLGTSYLLEVTSNPQFRHELDLFKSSWPMLIPFVALHVAFAILRLWFANTLLVLLRAPEEVRFQSIGGN